MRQKENKLFTPLEIPKIKRSSKKNKSLMGFQHKKITIMGLGLHGGGVGVAKFFCKQGAKVLVTDLKTEKELKESLKKLRALKINYILGRHRQEDFINTDLVIKNPAVPRESYFLKIAKEHKIPIKTDISVFFDLCRVQIIGVTGTKGKSTVATLIYNFLKTKYKNTILAGNIGISPLEVLKKIKKNSKIVLELSSFELEDLKKSPEMAVITTIFPDHLNRYKTLKEYIDAKTPIFKYQKKKDILILNYDNLLIRNFSKNAPSKVYFYSTKIIPSEKQKENFKCFLRGEEIFFADTENPVCNIKNIKLQGDHNISNILAAVSMAEIFKISEEKIKKTLLNFKGVAFRQEFIRNYRGVKYFNDTTATMPDASIAAIKTFKEKFPWSKIILIAGGQDKNLDYGGLAKTIKKEIETLVLLPGSASDKIKKELKTLKSLVPIFPADSMKKAVRIASKKAKRGDAVLLSPGAASFNLFKNEFDRGNQFNNIVKALSL